MKENEVIVGPKAPVEIADATLNWASGRHAVLPGGPNDNPFTSQIGFVSGLGEGVERGTSEQPFPRISQTPDSRGGACSGVDQIIANREFGGWK